MTSTQLAREISREFAKKASVHQSCTHPPSIASTAEALGRFASEHSHTIIHALTALSSHPAQDEERVLRVAKSVSCTCEWTPGCKNTALWTVDHLAYCQRHAEYAAFAKLTYDRAPAISALGQHGQGEGSGEDRLKGHGASCYMDDLNPGLVICNCPLPVPDDVAGRIRKQAFEEAAQIADRISGVGSPRRSAAGDAIRKHAENSDV